MTTPSETPRAPTDMDNLLLRALQSCYEHLVKYGVAKADTEKVLLSAIGAVDELSALQRQLETAATQEPNAGGPKQGDTARPAPAAALFKDAQVGATLNEDGSVTPKKAAASQPVGEVAELVKWQTMAADNPNFPKWLRDSCREAASAISSLAAQVAADNRILHDTQLLATLERQRAEAAEKALADSEAKRLAALAILKLASDMFLNIAARLRGSTAQTTCGDIIEYADYCDSRMCAGIDASRKGDKP